MRILLASHQYPPHGVAGIERYTAGLARELSRLGDDVGVLTRLVRRWPTVPELARDHDGRVRVFRLVGGTFHLERFLLNHRRLDDLAVRVLLEAEPDVVQVNHLIGLSHRLIPIAVRLRIPVVLTLQDHYFACPLAYLAKRSGDLCDGPRGGFECAATCFHHDPAAVEKWTLRARFFERLLELPDRVVCGSARVAAYFERLPHKSRPIDVMPLGVEAVAIARRDNTARARGLPLRLVYVGAVARHKGVHVIVDALRAAGVPAELTLIGQAYDAAYVEELRASANAAPLLTMTIAGEYHPEDVPTLVAGADAAIFPSQVREVHPFAPREVLAAGVPVIVGHLGGLPEVVVDGENGIVFDAHRPDELAAVIKHLGGDSGLLQRLRAGAAKTVVVSMARHAREMRDVYADVIAASRMSGRDPADALAEGEELYAALVAAGVGEG